MQNVNKKEYLYMWNQFADNKSVSYLTDKYNANNIVGLTGIAREHEIFRFLDLKPENELIDVGCASGHQVFRAAKICRRAIGIDVGKEFIDTANKVQKDNNITNVQFFLTEGEKIPFPDESFDRMICSEVLEHVNDEHVFLDELLRVLKKGGKLVFTVPNWNNRGTFYKRLKNGFRSFPFTPITDFSMEGIKKHGDAHVRQFTLKSFSDFVGSHNVEVTYVGGAAFIDGPKIGPIIKIINKSKFMQKLSFWFEVVIAKIPFFKYFGRHIVLQGVKIK